MRIARRHPRPIPASTASTRPSSDKLLASHYGRRRHGEVHQGQFAGLRVDPTASIAPWARPGRDPDQPSRFCDACFTGDYPDLARQTRASRSASFGFFSVESRPEASRVGAAPAGRLAGRLALITGASRGLGAATALALCPRGERTALLVARAVGGLEAVDDQIKAIGGSATLVPLDLTRRRPGMDRLGAALYERYGRLDVLLGNAGILGTLSPVGHIQSPRSSERVMAVNVTANWRLIRSLDPLLRQSDAGRAHLRDLRHLRAKRSPIGVPMPPARPRSTCWSESMPPRSRTPTCASTCSIPVRSARPCAPRPFRRGPREPDATRSARRGIDPPRPAVVHHDRPVGGGRRGVGADRRRQGLGGALMERSFTRLIASSTQSFKEAAACQRPILGSVAFSAASSLFRHVSKADTSPSLPACARARRVLGMSWIVRTAARRPGQIIGQGAERLQELTLVGRVRPGDDLIEIGRPTMFRAASLLPLRSAERR